MNQQENEKSVDKVELLNYNVEQGNRKRGEKMKDTIERKKEDGKELLEILKMIPDNSKREAKAFIRGYIAGLEEGQDKKTA